MQFRLKVFCFSAVLLVSSSCLAATIEPVQGKLYVNTGQGFLPVNGRINAHAGDAAFVDPGGIAMVVYPDGCKVTVQPGAVTTITPSSPCTNPYDPNNPFAQDNPLFNNNAALLGAAGLAAAGLGVGIYLLVGASP